MARSNVISVVGLGYVGLPTALAFHDAGHEVNGIDIDSKVINSLASGVSHLSDDSSDIEIPINSNRWNVSNSFSDVIPESDIVIITVPTPTKPDKTPDLRYVESAINSVVSNLSNLRRSIIILESTVFPGVTRRIAQKSAETNSKKIGVDFDIAYSPERISPGEVGKGAKEVSRIVGADKVEVGEMLAEIYGGITKGGCSYVGKIENAEAAKMIENTQRDIDIAFVNELALVLPRMGLDVDEVLEAASTKWNFHRHQPGIGVGGHCIPVDPYYYIQFSRNAGLESRLSPVAREVNESMPMESAKMISRVLKEGERVLIMGLSYKPNVGDIRETPVIPLIEELVRRGLEVSVWDPYISEDWFLPKLVTVVSDPIDACTDVNGIILATAHKEILDLDWRVLLEKADGDLLFDGPRALDSDKMSEIGWDYWGVGFPK